MHFTADHPCSRLCSMLLDCVLQGRMCAFILSNEYARHCSLGVTFLSQIH